MVRLFVLQYRTPGCAWNDVEEWVTSAAAYAALQDATEWQRASGVKNGYQYRIVERMEKPADGSFAQT